MNFKLSDNFTLTPAVDFSGYHGNPNWLVSGYSAAATDVQTAPLGAYIGASGFSGAFTALWPSTNTAFGFSGTFPSKSLDAHFKIKTGADITEQCIFAGLKESPDPAIEADYNSVFFRYEATPEGPVYSGAWCLVICRNGVAEVVDTVAVVADTYYDLHIKIDGSGSVFAEVNGRPARPYNIPVAIRTDIVLYPNAGVRTTSDAAIPSAVISEISCERTV